MTVTARALLGPKFASTTMAREYLAAEGRVIIDKFTATNNGAGAVALTVHIVPPAGVAATGNRIVRQQVVAVGETASITGVMGHVLERGAALDCEASAANALVLYASGRVVA